MMNIRELKTKLEDAEFSLGEKKKLVENLKDSRARRAVMDAARPILDSIDNQIEQARSDIENLEGVVAELKRQIQAAEQKEKTEKALFNERVKSLDPDIRRKSDRFVKYLRKAVELNKELLAYHRQRAVIENQTGRSIKGQGICGGFQSLELLADLAEGESQGVPITSNRWTYWIKNKLGHDLI